MAALTLARTADRAADGPPPGVPPSAGLARHLRGRRDGLLRGWRRRAAAKPDDSPLAEVGRREFVDAFDAAVDGLADRLHRPDGRPPAAIPAAGLARDWRRFRAATLTELNAYVRADAAFPEPAARAARKALSKYVFNGIDRAATRYRGMLREECDVRVGGLAETVRSQAEAVQERGAQLRQAAHDLRGSLGVVQMAVQVIDAPGTDDATREEMLAAVRGAAAEVSRMVEDLLSAGRLESGVEHAAPADFDLAALLTGLCESLAPEAGAAGARVLAAGPAKLPARTDAAMVRRVTQNLVLNALKYGGGGTVVRVDWADAPDVFEGRAGWRITVADDGPGLPPELAAAFAEGPPAPAAATGRPRDRAAVAGGEGVGLSIVRRLTDELEGTLDCRTGPDGTTFTLHLPALTGD